MGAFLSASSVRLRQESRRGGVEFGMARALWLVRESERYPLMAAAGSCQGMERAARVAAKLSSRNTLGFSNMRPFCFLFLAPT